MLQNRLLLQCLLGLLAWLLPLSTAAAQDHGAAQDRAASQDHGGQDHGAQDQGGHGHAPAKPTLEMANDAFFKEQYEHSVPYVYWQPKLFGNDRLDALLSFYNVNLFQWICLGLLFVLFLPVKGSFGKPNVGRFTRVLRGWCLWIRDDMVYAVMGKEEGRKWAPFFVFVFFFVAAMNCIGLIPSWPGLFSTYTATGTPYVTGALALITLALMVGFGMKHNGALGYIKGLMPHGLPTWLIPLMLVVELIGVIVKPFALTIRLFANMLAGHLVIASLIGLIFLFAKMQEGAATSYATILPGLGMAIFIFIIEAFVTLLQAYIFTYLSIIFLQQAIHQEH
ncbi:MAG: F0F1 ATP synthase subunit A [Planctomycetota bacterium]